MTKEMKTLNGYEVVDQAARGSVTNLKNEILKSIYSVGDIIVTLNSVNPANRFGGTWEQFGQGKTLIGVGIGDDYTTGKRYNFEVLQTGGEYTHILRGYEIPSHTHSIAIAKSGNASMSKKFILSNYTSN